MSNPFELQLGMPVADRVVSRCLGLDKLSRMYQERPRGLGTTDFLQHTLDVIGVTIDVRNRDRLAMVPEQGPLLIVANHPLGGLEGVAIARLLINRRPDLRILANALLRRIPELADLFIGVDVLSSNATQQNLAGIRQAHNHLDNGGALLIFPAGVVATFEPGQRVITDRPWNRIAGQLARRHRCACLPIHVGGLNSWYFYAVGLIHRRLRTVLLPRQLINKWGRRLPLSVGSCIPAQELDVFQSPRAMTEYLRISTEALAPGAAAGQDVQQRKMAGFAADVQRDKLQTAIAALDDLLLVEQGDFAVYCSPCQRLGVIMDQIAVSRELTFRMVGEGTGQAMDSDRFDSHYLHLFLWDRKDCRVAGAYRIGLVDKIVSERGIKGLYSRSLYRYDRAFLRQLGSAIEMGRSFIHPDYQRQPAALNLLWRGIGAFISANPGYHTLFGSVSISREYTDLARALIADTLMTNYHADGYSDLVRPLTPLRVRNRLWSRETLAALANIKILSKLIGRCDPGKAVPVLLRHYLALNGRLVCFNVHADFNDSLEGLIIVDLRHCDAKTAIRFMGEAGYNRFLDTHSLTKSA